MATLTFEYKVRDHTGSMKTGKLEAESPAQVAAKLKQMGYAPVSITKAGGGMNDPTGWCVALTDPAGSTKTFKYTAMSGLQSGACP